jgi:hypothetical protein
MNAYDALVPGAGFSDRELHVNMVLRWEFLPGSTFFLVWTHARDADALQAKVSYWIGG